MDTVKKTKKPSTALLVTVLTALFAACVVLAFILDFSGGSIVRVYQDGALVCEIDLDSVHSEYEFTLECASGSNTIAVRPGGICVFCADCSDQTCVKQGWLEGGLTPIVCLPHRLIIQPMAPADSFTPEEEAFDAVAG